MKVPETPELDAFYRRIAPANLAPLWQVFSRLITRTPTSDCQPALWRYADLRPLLMEAGGLISAKQAERRVLVLENPGLRDQAKITTSLYAGLQLVLPGEVAPAHRHSQSALRFILEGAGAYTSVDGEKTLMNVGDFVLTPSWAWHDHGNDSAQPMIWLDGLDVPLVQALDASFFEPYGEDAYPVTRGQGDSLARFGSGLLPVDFEAKSPASPVLNYPYARSLEALDQLRRADDWDACHGIKLTYVNPVTGGPPMPTIAAFLQLLPQGFAGEPYRATDATVFSVVDGTGTIELGETRLAWGPKDTFVVPSWRQYRLLAESEAVLFSFSDRPVHKALGLWREHRGA